MAGSTRPCLSCGHEIPSPLDVCLRCGGSALYKVPDAEWAVEAGSIPSMKFRTTAVEFLASSLEGVDKQQADKLLADGRVRVAEGLTERGARGLAQRLGSKETSALAVQGAAKPVGLSGSMRFGLPILGLIGGAIFGLVVHPIGWAIGLLAGVGLGAMNAMRRLPVLGWAPVRPTLPYQVADAPEKLAALREKLPERPREALMTVGDAGFRILGRVTDPEDLLATGADGIDGGMGQGALGLVKEAVRIAELIARDGPGPHNDERIEMLEELAQTARKAMAAFDNMERTITDRGESGAVAVVQEETAHLTAAIENLEKVR